MSREAFIDELTIAIYAGDGGGGLVSFRREKFAPFGGPNGGDGGRGGNVIVVADRNLATLNEQKIVRVNRAESGIPGGGSNKTGRRGADSIILVPVGTLVYDTDAEGGEQLLADLDHDGASTIVGKGGRGGRGNSRFTTSTRQAPDFAERGQPGQIRQLRLSLKMLADVGLVGFPNAGKSTLLSRISGARPRIAAYPFTTLIPALGVAEVGERRFVVADIPGLIEGASGGAGLGAQFLRHIERTRVLVHLIDAGAAVLEGRDIASAYDSIRHELGNFEAGLLDRREIVVLNKLDLVSDRDVLAAAEEEFARRGIQLQHVSGVTGEGLDGRGLADEAFADIARQISELADTGRDVVLVSSGAIAIGNRDLGWDIPGESIPEKQAAAAVGQIGLTGLYKQHFARFGRQVAQILLTRSGLEDHERFLNARHTLGTLLRSGVVPIVNENDTVATDEIRFGDNDNLSATVVNLVAADLLIVLTDVDGLYVEPPREGAPEPRRFEVVDQVTPEIQRAAQGSTSGIGRGGMTTKLEAAQVAARGGAATVLCNGRVPFGQPDRESETLARIHDANAR